MFHQIKDAFSFPFRGGGKYILLVGGVLGVISDLASLAPLIGIIAVIFMLGYMISTYFQIIQSSATGSDEAPEFPEMSNILEDLIYPVLQVIFVGVVSFIPFFAWRIFSEGGGAIEFLLVLLGIAYFPMAMMAVVVLGQLRAASPLLVVPAIMNSGGYYWIAVASLIFLYILESLIMEFFDGFFIVGTLVAAFLGMYTLMTNGRILGLIYREKEEELGWL